MTPGAAWDRFWFAPIPLARLGSWRALVCAVALYDVLLYAGTVLRDARLVDAGSTDRSWNPIYLFDLLGVQPIGVATAQLVLGAAIVTLALGAVGLWSRTCCLLGGLLFVYWTGLAYSFGKPHHDKIALTFALLALPWSPAGARISVDAILAAFRRARRGEPEPPADRTTAAAPLRLAQVTIAIGYCAAGLSKLWLGGLAWFNGYTLQGILLAHDNGAARWFASSVAWCRFQSVGLVVTQAAFPLLFVLPKLRWFFLPSATLFHLVTWVTMDTGAYMRLWLLLAAFLPLEAVPAIVRGWLRSGALRAIPAALLALGLPALVVYVVLPVVPVQALAIGIGPLALAAVLYLLPAARIGFVFDGGCRLCRATVALLRGLDFGDRVEFVDLHDDARRESLHSDLDRSSCLRDVHAVTAGGRIHAGFAAYQALAWRLPLLLPIAPILRLPPVAAVGRAWYRRVAARRLRVGCGLSGGGSGFRPDPAAATRP
jgi:predicted DCC family thiol-disulfide oxidoreductase YuxK